MRFLLEYNAYSDRRSQVIPINHIDHLRNFLKNNASWYWKQRRTITPIYRGIKGEKYLYQNKMASILEIKPKKFHRKARNTDNHYIQLLDNSPYWEGYPKRSQSIICSLNFHKASNYMGLDSEIGDVYRVIPKDPTTPIVICPSSDVFFSFHHLENKFFENLGVSISTVSDLNQFLIFAFGIQPQYTIKDIEKKVNTIYQRIVSGQLTIDNASNTRNYEAKLIQGINNNPKFTPEVNFFELLNSWMNPKDNGFKLTSYSQGISIGNEEAYTSGDCFLVKESDFKKFIEYIRL